MTIELGPVGREAISSTLTEINGYLSKLEAEREELERVSKSLLLTKDTLEKLLGAE